MRGGRAGRGAYWGLESIPAEWIGAIIEKEWLGDYIDPFVVWCGRAQREIPLVGDAI